MKQKLIQIFLQIFATKIGWTVICILLAGLATYLPYPHCIWVSHLLLIYPAGLLLLSIYFAMINAAKDAKK